MNQFLSCLSRGMFYKGYAILLQWHTDEICKYLLGNMWSNFFPDRVSDQKILETCNLEGPLRIQGKYSSSPQQSKPDKASGCPAKGLMPQHAFLTVLGSNSDSVHTGWVPSYSASLTSPSRKGWGWIRHWLQGFFRTFREALPALSRGLAFI